ncbi:MAG: TonB-dependent receptor domain-containing protein [Thermoanaerobaculia bacterium]
MGIGRRLGRYGLMVVAAVLFAVTPSWAQSVHDGTVTGTVTLASGEAIPGVTVTISGPSLITGERTVYSGDGGRFVFLSVPPGTYTLTATLEGMRTFSARDIVIHSGDKVDLPVTLQPGSFEDEIVVTAASPIVDTRTAQISTTFTEQLIEAVPTSRDAFYDIALTAPGMSDVGKEGSWLPSPSAFGSAANENIFLVNGVNTTNPRGAPWGSLVAVNYNTVEEVQILSLGSKAEYGSFSGAAIDVLTKSGGNEFTGDVAFFTMLGDAADNSTLSFGDDVLYADPADQLNSKPLDSSELSLTLGGPVMRDRVWFYAGFGTYEAETDIPLFGPNSTWDQDIYDLKLTGEFGSNHRGWLAYHTEEQIAGNNTWGQTWDDSMVYNQPRDNDTLQAQYQWVISDRGIFSFKALGFQTEEHPTLPDPQGTPGYINWWKYIGSQSIGLGGDFPYVEKQVSERQTYQADFSHYADDFLGEHEVKFGVQYTQAEGNWIGGYFHGYANFAYPYPYQIDTPAKDFWWNGPESWQWGTDEDPVVPWYNMKIIRNPWLTVRQSDNTAAFVDDTWVVNDRLTFNLGLRWDNSTAAYGEGAVFDFPTTPGDLGDLQVIRTRQGMDVFDFDTISPRLGMVYTLTDDAKTVLRVNLGRYYSPMSVETLRRFGPDMEPTTTEVWYYMFRLHEVDLNGNGKLDFDEIRPGTRLLVGREPDTLNSTNVSDPSWFLDVEEGTGNPFTDQFHVSVQRQLGSDFAVEASYIYKLSQDFLVQQIYDPNTGEYYEWEKRPFTTFTGHQTSVWSIVLKDYNNDGAVDIEDAKYINSNKAARATNLESFDGKDVEREYSGVQLVFTKRYSNRWQGLASVNWSTTDGIAPRTMSQDWYIDGPMIMDTPFGSSMNHFQNNIEGALPMTPEWLIKVAGSYRVPTVETDLGLRVRYDSGRAIFPIQPLSTFANWMSSIPPNAIFGGGSDQLVADDEAFWMPATTIVDLSVQRDFAISDFGLRVSVDVLNAFNEDSPNRIGFRPGDFGRVYGIVNPRVIRGGVKFTF